MYKGVITLSVDKTLSEGSKKAIRDSYNQQGYKVNMIINGDQDNKEMLSRFIMERLRQGK